MDKISEADNEDERYNTLFDKIADELRDKEEYKVDEQNIDDLIGKNNNIKQDNVKDFFDPCLYNNTEENYKTKEENKNRFKNNPKIDTNSINREDLSQQPSYDPIEVRIH